MFTYHLKSGIFFTVWMMIIILGLHGYEVMMAWVTKRRINYSEECRVYTVLAISG